MKFEFTQDYWTGIDSIDKEHAHLFELTNEAYDIMADEFRSDKYDRIVALLNELGEYAKSHFAHEEEFMESFGFRHIWSEKHQHMSFCQKLDAIDLKKMDESQQQYIMDVLDFLIKWLQGHIKGADKRIGVEYSKLHPAE